jgi:hypothetical protein
MLESVRYSAAAVTRMCEEAIKDARSRLDEFPSVRAHFALRTEKEKQAAAMAANRNS